MSRAQTASQMLSPAAILVDGIVLYSSVVLGLAEGAPIAAICVLAALIAMLFIDPVSGRGIPTPVAAALGIAAFGLALAEFLNGSLEARILSGAHLICYLATIVLLQAKALSDVYRLLMLSVLQVALSALLTNSLWLAFALAGYMLLAFVALSTLLWTQLSVAALSGGDVVASESGFTAIKRLAGNSIRLTVVCLVVGGIGFAFVPRVWSGQLSIFNADLASGTVGETGFSEQVELGEIGQVMESDDLALEIRSRKSVSGEPSRIDEEAMARGLGETLLRGAVMTQYEGGSWRSRRAPLRRSVAYTDEELERRGEEEFDRHVVRAEPFGSSTLFAPSSVLAIRSNQPDRRRVEFDAENYTFARDDSEPANEVFEYEFLTSPGWEFGPNTPNLIRLERGPRGQRLLDELISVSSDALRTDLLSYIRAEIPAAFETDDRLELAVLIQDHLKASGGFAYSLDLTPSPGDRDPILKFLQTDKRGHCEYFASALALLLRAIDVPTRLVNGYKGGTFDEEAGVFQVRQLHAHAWVEVLGNDGEQWFTFDPTPAGRDTDVEERIRSVASSPSLWNRASDVWNRGMFLTRQQQQRYVYGPLAGLAQDGFDAVGIFTSEKTTASGQRRAALAAAATMILITIAIAIGVGVWLRRRNASKRASRGVTKRRTERQQAEVDAHWYLRFVSLVKVHLARERTASQTHEEFAESLSANLVDAEPAVGDELRTVAPQVTAMFYRTRFGQKPVSESEIKSVETKLIAVESAIADSHGDSGAAPS